MEDPPATGESTRGLGTAHEQTDLLTRFLIFEPVPGQGPNPTTWTIVGAETGRDRNNATRKFYGDDEPLLYVAVSENQWRPRQPRSAPFKVPDRVEAPGGVARAPAVEQE